MKNLVFVLMVIISLGSCGKKTTVNKQFYRDTVKEHTMYRSMEEINKELDSLNAHGEYLLIRGAERDYDTIIDHIHYIYTTEE